MKLYGIEHILFLLFGAIVITTTIILVKRYVKTEKQLTFAIKIIAGILLLCIIANRSSLAIKSSNWLSLIPGTYCGVTSLTFSVATLLTKKNSTPLHFLCYMGFVGAVVTLSYPDFLLKYNSIFEMGCITSLLHHLFMLNLMLTMSITKYFVPNIKKWYALILGLCCYMTWGIFLVDIVGIGAMQIGRDFEGFKGLTWFNVGLIFMAVSYAYMAVYTFLPKLIKSKRTKELETQK